MNKLVARSIYIGKKKTSIKLENHAWDCLREIAERENLTIHEICSNLYEGGIGDLTLSCAVRTFILLYFRDAATEQGHIEAGHGNQKLKNINQVSVVPNESIHPVYEDFHK